MKRRTDGLAIREVTELESLRRLVPEWNALWESCENMASFQRPEWLLTWVEVFRPQELWVLEARRGGRLVGLAPLFVNHWTAEPVLSTLGAYTSDYLDWLIEPESAHKTLAAILDYIQSDGLAAWGLDFANLPQHSYLLRPGLLQEWEFEIVADEACPVIWLPQRGQDQSTVVAGKQLRNLRKARRRAERVGEIKIEVATSETLDEFVGALLRLHQARWNERRMPGVLADCDVRLFHRRATRALLERGVLRLYGLRLGGVLIAVLYGLAERDVVYCYLQGFDPEYAEFSPGMQILGAAIEDAMQQGKRAVDLLRGREAYKYAWGAQDVPIFRLRSRPRVPESSLLIQNRKAA